MQKYEKAGCWAGGKLVLFRFVGSVVDVVNWFGYELYIAYIAYIDSYIGIKTPIGIPYWKVTALLAPSVVK